MTNMQCVELNPFAFQDKTTKEKKIGYKVKFIGTTTDQKSFEQVGTLWELPLGLEIGDIVTYEAANAGEYKGEKQWKFKNVEIIEKAPDNLVSFGEKTQVVPGQFANTTENLLKNLETKDEKMERMAKQRDEIAIRQIEAMEKLTAALDRLQKELLRHDNL